MFKKIDKKVIKDVKDILTDCKYDINMKQLLVLTSKDKKVSPEEDTVLVMKSM